MKSGKNPFDESAKKPVASNEKSGKSEKEASAEKSKKSKRNLILGLSIGGGVLFIGLIITLILIIVGGVSKADYEQVSKLSEEARTNYSKINSFRISSYSTKSQIEDKVETLKENRQNFDEKFDQIGESKAIKKDKTAKEIYGKAVEAKKEMDEYLDTAIEAYEVIVPFSKDLSQVSSDDSDEAIEALKDYQAELRKMKLKNKVNKDYVDEINSILPKFIDSIEKYANMDYENYDSSVYSDFRKQTRSLNDADRKWQSNLTKLSKKVNLSSEMNELNKYIESKLNGKK